MNVKPVYEPRCHVSLVFVPVEEMAFIWVDQPHAGNPLS